MTLLKLINKTSLLIPYEQFFIQTCQYNGTLITEQNRGEQNPLFSYPSIQVSRHNCSITNEYQPYDTHESVPNQKRQRMIVDPGM